MSSSFLVLLRFNELSATVVHGDVDTNERWLFLARFCFLSESGKFTYEVSYPLDYGTERILLYYDESDQWDAVYKTKTTCYEKQDVLNVKNGQFINLTLLFNDNAGCTMFRKDFGDYYNCSGNRMFSTARERWWFIALSSCESKKGLKFKYRFEMTNHENSFWFKHFSADEFYILPTNIIFTVAYTILIGLTIVCSVKLVKKHLFHATYKLFIVSVAYKLMSLVLLCISYGQYAMNGFGYPTLKILGRIGGATSEYLFLLMLLLIAKGYTITRGRLRTVSSIKLAVFMIFYLINYAALFVYQQLYFDPGKVLYFHESPAGFAMMALRFLAFFWFGYAILRTIQHYREKMKFYIFFFVFYSAWFLAGPIQTIVATTRIPKHNRAKIVHAVELLINLIAHVGFLILTWPIESNKRFPYHVKTSQIDVMRQSAQGTTQDCSLDMFPHQPYPSTDPANRYYVPNYDNLFTVGQRMREVDNGRQNVNGNLGDECAIDEHITQLPNGAIVNYSDYNNIHYPAVTESKRIERYEQPAPPPYNELF
ncbi:TMEM145 (predicted) [Pycnogonum litorale]